MSHSVWVVGTFDQPIEALFAIDLMRWLEAARVPLAGVAFKRSDSDQNPALPVVSESGDGRRYLHVRAFNDEATVSALCRLKPDLLIYAGGRDILRRPLLESAALGCIGGHYGKLPAIRGMATVEWSVLLGVAPTVAIQRISPGIDTGDLLMQAQVPLFGGDTFTSIRNRSYFLTKTMLALAARRLLDGSVEPKPQIPAAGRQYYRLSPTLQQCADAALDRLLAARL